MQGTQQSLRKGTILSGNSYNYIFQYKSKKRIYKKIPSCIQESFKTQTSTYCRHPGSF